MTRRDLKILLAGPRGFCAGVDRAVTIVEKTLEKYGAPVFVRHEIVHNKFVVESLEAKGAVFIKELNEVPTGKTVIFSAHGVPKSVPSIASAHNIIYLDATCPLVSRVHRSVESNYKKDFITILIGHHGHPEVIGTMGQLPTGAIILVASVKDVENLQLSDDTKLSWATQTTLSVGETKTIINALKSKFPSITGPDEGDICFATTNRQAAVRKIAEISDGILILGAKNSSNSNRLVDVGKDILDNNKNSRKSSPSPVGSLGEKSLLIQSALCIDWSWFDNIHTVGISAGASAPEILVDEVIKACKKRFNVTVEEVIETIENVSFPLPHQLTKQQ